jgi:hypothetical protein
MCIQRSRIFNTFFYLHYNPVRTEIDDKYSVSWVLVYCILIHDVQ